jgi:hypothetical protein
VPAVDHHVCNTVSANSTQQQLVLYESSRALPQLRLFNLGTLVLSRALSPPQCTVASFLGLRSSDCWPSLALSGSLQQDQQSLGFVHCREVEVLDSLQAEAAFRGLLCLWWRKDHPQRQETVPVNGAQDRESDSQTAGTSALSRSTCCTEPLRVLTSKRRLWNGPLYAQASEKRTVKLDFVIMCQELGADL